jgi:glutaredoxin
MSYTLFVGDNCHECAEVIAFLEQENFEHRQVNIDHEEEKPPLEIFVYPALFKGKELICYGSDIKRYVTEIS